MCRSSYLPATIRAGTGLLTYTCSMLPAEPSKTDEERIDGEERVADLQMMSFPDMTLKKA